MNTTLAIVVPVYNVERYLCECIDSILVSSFTNFELLLIDDGSTDSSGTICNDYVQKDSRVKVFHKPNGGVSSARNVGIEHTKAEWITFVDADDMVAPTFFENLYRPVTEYSDIDFVQAGCENYQFGRITNIEQKYDFYVGSDKLKLLNQVRGLTFSKLYKTDILRSNGCFFDEKIHSTEDLQFTLEYILYVKKYTFIQETGYYYRRDNVSSITHTATNYPYKDCLYIFKQRFTAVKAFVSKYQLEQPDFSVRNEQLAFLLFFAICNGLYSNADSDYRLFHLRHDFTNEELNLSCYCEGKVNRVLFILLRKKYYRVFDFLMRSYIKYRTK